SSYTLLGLKTVYLGERNAVGFGSVGVTGPYGLASIGPNSFVAAPGSFVNAKFIRVAPSAVVFTKIYAPALVTLPVMQYNTRNVSGLPIINVPANTTTTLNGNYRYLNVGKGAHVTLNGNLFGDIRLAEGGELIFNSASIDIRSLTMDNGTLSARTTANFNANSRISVRVSDKVVIGEHCRVSGSNMVFYIGDKRTDIERFSVRARDTHVEANVFIPNGILLVSGNNAPGTECVMTGYFIADVIVSLGREVLWNPRFCNVPLPLTVNNEITGQRTEGELEVQKSIAGSPMKISVYPNPSAQYFNMVIQSEKADQLQVSIYDVSGRKIEQINGPSNKTYTFGYQYRPGIYLVEVQRGKEKNTIKVVKL
ncbi:MAG: T9SS type A sorting domain-containing protein, partial [Chitinophagaceae bacterium]